MEAWSKAVEQARAAAGNRPPGETQVLNLDNRLKAHAVGQLTGYLNLQELSICSVGISSLEGFPSLPQLRRLTLSDNRIAGGLEHLASAQLTSLTDLDLSNNRLARLRDLAPLAQLKKLHFLDLYRCPVTNEPGYREGVFKMLDGVKYLDSTDQEGNDRPESDEEEEGEDEYEDEDSDGGLEEGVTVNVEGGMEEEEDEEDEEDGEEGEEFEDEDLQASGHHKHYFCLTELGLNVDAVEFLWGPKNAPFDLLNQSVGRSR